MSHRPTVVIFFNDWKVYPNGVNAGGGESATMALGRSIARLGYRVIACANLPEGETHQDGVDFWNFGSAYELHRIERRLREIGSYHCLCATLVHPLLHLREQENCLSRILINHAPSAHGSGLEPATVTSLVDYMICVSHAQRSLILNRGIDAEKLVVVKNGFDEDVFSYAGPANRDWNQLMFIGRVEAAKGIHVLIQAFGELKREFPLLKLDVFGDESYWPEFTARKQELITDFPGLTFNGKVPQRKLSERLRTAGLLVFPSLTFETAGLAVVDAQASGCPVVAFGVGGVPEYLVEGKLGEVIYEKTPEALRNCVATLLRNRERMEAMSRLGTTLGRERPWSKVAEEVLMYAERAAAWRRGGICSTLPQSLQRIGTVSGIAAESLLEDHELVAFPDIFSDDDLSRAIALPHKEAWPHLVRGIRLEKNGSVEQAMEAYRNAASSSARDDWQAFFRLALLHADRQELMEASRCAEEVLARSPHFPFRSQLEQLISMARPS
jgi:glycosyltransferase involved in cell wall biosynthesis